MSSISVRSIWFSLLMVVLVSAGYAKPAPASAPTVPSDYYKGKTITLIVPASAAGGTDILARITARHLGNFIPGKPSVVVINMPGGGGNLGLNYGFNIAKRDGLTLIQANGPSAVSGLLREEGAKYDYTKMKPILGAYQAEIHCANSDILRDPKEILKAKGFVYGYTPMPSGITLGWQLGKTVLGFKSKDVLTFTDGGDALSSLLSGEINAIGSGTNFYYSRLRERVKAGKLTPLWQSGLFWRGEWQRSPEAPDALTFIELHEAVTGKKPSGPYWEMMEAYMVYYTSVLKFVMLPPGAEEYATILREATEKMLRDPQVLLEYEKLVVDRRVLFGGQEADEVMKNAREKALPMVKKLQEWITSGWGVSFQKN